MKLEHYRMHYKNLRKIRWFKPMNIQINLTNLL
jgi:hypothetical protein